MQVHHAADIHNLDREKLRQRIGDLLSHLDVADSDICRLHALLMSSRTMAGYAAQLIEAGEIAHARHLLTRWLARWGERS